MKENTRIDVEKMWNLKVEAHNNILNYLEVMGLSEKELLKFLELLNKYSKSAIKLNNYIS